MQEFPIVIVAVAVILVVAGVVLGLTIRRKRKADTSGQPVSMNRRAFSVQFAAGLAVALLGAFFMWEGGILGEDTTSIARIMGIVGICLIATSPATGRAIKP